MWRKLTIFGMLGVIVYVFHVVLGGFLWKGYSHIDQPISDLSAQGAPDKALIGYILYFYAAFLLIFAVSAFMYTRSLKSKLISAGMILFICMEIVSTMYNFFPEDLRGAAMTFQGFMHIVVTALIVPFTISSVLVIGLGLRKIKTLKTYGIYSIVTSIILFTAGGFSVYIMANKLECFGLVERINIGSLQIWTFVMSLKLFRTDLEVIHKEVRVKM